MGPDVTILHLGVIDIPYTEPKPPQKVAKPHKGPARVRKGSKTRKTDLIGGQNTTGDVAEILEAKYRLMETFYEVHEEQIVGQIEESVKGALETLLAGGPVEANPFAEATDQIEHTFKDFLDQKGFDGIIAGVATEAAKKGVNHRLKHPYAKDNPPRPSFIDTGQYQASFKAWVEG